MLSVATVSSTSVLQSSVCVFARRMKAVHNNMSSAEPSVRINLYIFSLPARSLFGVAGVLSWRGEALFCSCYLPLGEAGGASVFVSCIYEAGPGCAPVAVYKIVEKLQMEDILRLALYAPKEPVISLQLRQVTSQDMFNSSLTCSLVSWSECIQLPKAARWLLALLLRAPRMYSSEQAAAYLATVCHTPLGGGKQEIPEKTRQPVASSGTIPTCENTGLTRQGIKPGWPWWEASMLTGHPAELFTKEKADAKHVYTEVEFPIGSQVINHAMDYSERIAGWK
ncbi:hypothetical protein PR048_019025 [Dryococelus australis]|uniref:Uncharacterized protein n=1 Tax=Dryococelus australis TaxID=614101 RepID=A0ABQ9H2B5_9NEOP|nr:hypothetical protein PR048_019025 [Dryococelus australis]